MAEEVPPDADAAASFADDVGASVIVEAGAPSGTLTLPASAMKFADLTESGSESGDNEAGSGSGSGDPGTSAAATGGRSSPPPNCAICLSRCHRKCFTDSWRRYVYDRKLYALPVSDSLTCHFREWSARFYRNNPAQMHRLMPWIQRDIVCLLRNAAHSVGTVMQLMHDILPMTNMLGPTFRRRLSPYLGDRTSHFIHELFNFARSPFDMIGYDHVVQYSARVAEEVEVDLLDMVETQSSNESDLHLEVVDGVDGEVPSAEASNEWSTANGGPGGRPSTSVIVTNPSATHSFSVTMASDDK